MTLAGRYRRERHFQDALSEAYAASARRGARVFYASTMPYLVGTASYWRGHGWKLANAAQSIGWQIVHSLWLIADVYSIRDCVELRGSAAQDRREIFWDFHRSSPTDRIEFLWETEMQPLIDGALQVYRDNTADNLLGQRDMMRLEDVGADVWHDYTNRRPHLYSKWRITKRVSAALDQRFALLVTDMFGYTDPYEPVVSSDDDDDDDSDSLAAWCSDDEIPF